MERDRRRDSRLFHAAGTGSRSAAPGRLGARRRHARWSSTRAPPSQPRCRSRCGRMPERVVDEQAPVRLLDDANPLLNSPNKITAADFDGWVEERGHSFLDSWDPGYTALTETADPGQDPQRGGLVVISSRQGDLYLCRLCPLPSVAGVGAGPIPAAGQFAERGPLTCSSDKVPTAQNRTDTPIYFRRIHQTFIEFCHAEYGNTPGRIPF